MIKYKRVLLKLSGEALSDEEGRQILKAETLKNAANSVKSMVDAGVQVSIVVGAGNIWRGKLAETIGIDQASADYMGMLGTIINALALQSSIEETGISCRVLSAISAQQVAEPYIRRRAIRHLEKGRVIIFAGGTGNPYFTTDTTAALRAQEMLCDAILMAKNGADGIYSSDPNKSADAVLIERLTYRDLLKMELKVMDSTAVSLLMNSNVVTRVFNGNNMNNCMKVVYGEPLGTTITKEEN